MSALNAQIQPDSATPNAGTAAPLAQGRWELDPTRSSVEFQVPHFWGLMTVKGRFTRFAGSVDLDARPAARLTIDASSLDTRNAKRDKHLRSAAFFDVARHPVVEFVSDDAALDGPRLRLRGTLEAAGKQLPIEIDAAVSVVGSELEVDGGTQADHRNLDMTWSPLGMLRAPSRLVVHARLTRAPEGADRR